MNLARLIISAIWEFKLNARLVLCMMSMVRGDAW